MKSGFNLLSLKKENNENVKKHYFSHIVVGDDLFCLQAVHKLMRQQEGSVAWISPRELGEQDLKLQGPSLLRGQHNIDWFQKNYPEVQINISENKSQFYKELKWRDFGGRAKSETLLWNEEFFTQKRALFNEEQIFSFAMNESVVEEIKKNRLDVSVISVESTSPEDLAEPAHFILKTSNGDEVHCDKLYWGKGPSEFVTHYAALDDLNSTFIEVCEQTKTPSALYITLEFDGVVTDKEETLFIPLSYTHEWGHFVGEFYGNSQGQRACFVTYLDKNACTEEDISKKIRLLKRNLEKIFPDFSKVSYGEFIRLADDSFCLNVDDAVLIEEMNKIKNLKFISINAPFVRSGNQNATIADSLSKPEGIIRALQTSISLSL